MSTTFQLILVGIIVVGATGYVLRASWRTWTGAGKPGCSSGCGKCNTPALEPQVPTNGRKPLPMA